PSSESSLLAFSSYPSSLVLTLFFFFQRPPPSSTLFPYTTLFRSLHHFQLAGVAAGGDHVLRRDGGRDQAHGARGVGDEHGVEVEDRKSTRLNSSHVATSYAVFCLKKKKKAESEVAIVADFDDVEL